MNRISLIAFSGAIATAAAHAQPALNARPETVHTPNTCLLQAASYHGVNPLILRAIVYHESRDNPNLVLRNTNGTEDLGLAGLNTVHLAELARYGIRREQLLDGCVNMYVAAWHLRKQVSQYGNTWTAVGSYHSKTPVHRDRYAKQIYDVLLAWRAVP
ncbi:soluble lytic murein transglycosylase-like protein [Variovorax boronicumulans]|uniref:Soluble lytic murein transglycosylase-like protein n=1 Tax=Variovorax boronicumulans TaxID=436515 RepID=A0AAW8D4N1_9BURK|nr:lytic transglycosylase domain-containing protein [Variovorax boronicumulans]MDP9897367.1 soluble lytic murein transglycosylase-like protein [Variovorax boronicumulans]MDQ0057399.1 soluble lytic murein transglycosylase-like protein [Variovorax boronicumulans]